MRVIDLYSELGEKVPCKLIAVNQLKVSGVNCQLVADVKIFHRVELRVSGAGTRHTMTTHDCTYMYTHTQPAEIQFNGVKDWVDGVA